jgi:hypothetical protein
LTRSFARHAIIGVKRLSTASVRFFCRDTRDKALEQSDRRIDELTAAGDHAGADTCRRITAAVVQLANTTPPGPLH